tara:strand:- start:146889 stop:148268 length:1380 start_codon:yes stop_codon:yes gene_type:complete
VTHPIFRRDVFCWASYDWANSAYTTLVITVCVAYIQRVVFPVAQWGSTGAVLWAWSISLSMLLGAILSPIVGAIADARGSKRVWLGATALSGSAASILLAAVPPSMYVLVVILFVFANLMLELSLGFYNGFLPEIVDEKEMNTVSAWGYGLGYVGGGIALAIAMAILHFGETFGLETMSGRLRCSLMMMGLWWGIFSLPAIVMLRDRPRQSRAANGLPVKEPLFIGESATEGSTTVGSTTVKSTTGVMFTARSAIASAMRTFRSLPAHPALAWFLLSFLFYNDGIQTIISQASTFALHELSFPESELMAVILMIQLLALPGAVGIGKCADVLGMKPTLMVTLIIWIVVLCAALLVSDKRGFWLMAAVIAFVLGGTQSVSRSLMAVMTPEHQSAEYFGFFNLSGKATSFIGTFLFGAIVAVTGSSRLAIFGLLPLFVVGILLLSRVRAPDTNVPKTSKLP